MLVQRQLSDERATTLIAGVAPLGMDLHVSVEIELNYAIIKSGNQLHHFSAIYLLTDMRSTTGFSRQWSTHARVSICKHGRVRDAEVTLKMNVFWQSLHLCGRPPEWIIRCWVRWPFCNNTYHLASELSFENSRLETLSVPGRRPCCKLGKCAISPQCATSNVSSRADESRSPCHTECTELWFFSEGNEFIWIPYEALPHYVSSYE